VTLARVRAPALVRGRKLCAFV